jgi:hypothetical protein
LVLPIHATRSFIASNHRTHFSCGDAEDQLQVPPDYPRP